MGVEASRRSMKGIVSAGSAAARMMREQKRRREKEASDGNKSVGKISRVSPSPSFITVLNPNITHDMKR